MKQESRQQSQESSQTESQQSQAREFATTEELLQHDAAQTEVPRVIAERLKDSIQSLPRPTPSWWQRWLKR